MWHRDISKRGVNPLPVDFWGWKLLNSLHPRIQKNWSNIQLGCPPSQDSSQHQDSYIFRIGDPELNLHLPPYQHLPTFFQYVPPNMFQHFFCPTQPHFLRKNILFKKKTLLFPFRTFPFGRFLFKKLSEAKELPLPEWARWQLSDLQREPQRCWCLQL